MSLFVPLFNQHLVSVYFTIVLKGHSVGFFTVMKSPPLQSMSTSSKCTLITSVGSADRKAAQLSWGRSVVKVNWPSTAIMSRQPEARGQTHVRCQQTMVHVTFTHKHTYICMGVGILDICNYMRTFGSQGIYSDILYLYIEAVKCDHIIMYVIDIYMVKNMMCVCIYVYTIYTSHFAQSYYFYWIYVYIHIVFVCMYACVHSI